MDLVVINLASQPQRWDRVRAQFAAAGMAVRRVEAVDGEALTRAARTKLCDPALNRRQHHKPLRPGEIGCYASHLAVWQQLLDGQQPAMAVFEDDIEIDPGLGPTLEAIRRLPSGWDVIKLCGRDQELPGERRPLAAGADLVCYRRLPSYTCAYVVSRRGALKLLHSRLPFGRPVDVDMRHWWENELAVCGVLPYPVRRAECSRLSTIDAGRRGCTGPAMRLQKLALQARYALLNWHHARRQALPGAARHGEPLPPVPAWPHDAA